MDKLVGINGDKIRRFLFIQAYVLIIFGIELSYAQEMLADPRNLVSARASGMGKAFTAMVDDATSIYWNPAAMSLLENGQVGLMVRYGKLKVGI
jgi:long-subunit fatty acid transport protein